MSVCIVEGLCASSESDLSTIHIHMSVIGELCTFANTNKTSFFCLLYHHQPFFANHRGVISRFVGRFGVDARARRPSKLRPLFSVPGTSFRPSS